MRYTRGFTIFFAVLVSSLALAVGVAIYDLLVRELQLSEVATQSQKAIYAADVGAECALYWDFNFNTLVPTDLNGSAFATSSSDRANGGTGELMSGINCNGRSLGEEPLFLIPSFEGANYATTTFILLIGDFSDNSCASALVDVGKYGTPSQTTIISRGISGGPCGSSGTVAPGIIQVERALQVSY